MVVKTLHADVERETRRLHLLHADHLQCRRGCSACCVDDLTVWDVEAELIREAHAELLRDGIPREVGACAFLDAEGGCRVYANRPYVCRTQGLPLRWLEVEDGQEVEIRDICPLNMVEVPIEELPADDCWTLGPFEERLARLQLQARPSPGHSAESRHAVPSGRVLLRSLFSLK